MGGGIAAIVLWTSVAAAQQLQPARHQRPSDRTPGHPFEFRVGASRIAGMRYRPELCVAGSPWPWLSVEACGTGAGVLHRDPIPEIAHFRAKLRVGTMPVDLGRLRWFGALGFSELQVARDAPGFEFRGVQGRTATSGPEAGAGLRLSLPRPGGPNLLFDAHLSIGWFPHAADVAPDLNAFQPSGSLTMGVGF